MQYFCSFTSGSKGNSAIYVKDETPVQIQNIFKAACVSWDLNLMT